MATIVDGKSIAADILHSLKIYIDDKGIEPNLLVLTSAPGFATKQFLSIKEKRAKEIGVFLTVNELPLDATVELIIEAIEAAVTHSDGIVLQLPFSERVDVSNILEHLPASHDVDGIGAEAVDRMMKGNALVLPPVVAAIKIVCEKHSISLEGENTVVVGEGRLVGRPAAIWLKQQGAEVLVLNKDSKDIAKHTKEADILILGAGSPGIIKPDMVKDGVIIFDAGTSEDAGKLAGDADPACGEKASLITPVPGGIGPITIVELFRNLLILKYGYGK